MCCPELVRSIPAASTRGDDRHDAALAVPPEALGRLRRVCDLTHALTPDFPVFPAYRPFRSTRLFSVEANGFSAGEVAYAEHTGTHLDAPAHFFADGATTDLLPVGRFVAPLAVVSIADRAARDEDALLTVDDLAQWERRHGRIPAGAWVLLRTDWSKREGADAFLNVGEDGPHSPGFHQSASALLAHERDVLGVGVETVGTDAGQAGTFDPPFPNHGIMHGAGKFGLASLCNLDQLPATGAVVIAAPLKIADGSGSPLRVIALSPA